MNLGKITLAYTATMTSGSSFQIRNSGLHSKSYPISISTANHLPKHIQEHA